jgi:hypothetical protein
MLFETLFESAKRGELLLLDGGLAHFHIRKDAQMTLREIIVTRPGCGIGRELLHRMETIGRERGATSILARCPADLAGNGWYRRMGFILEGEERSGTGRRLLRWRLPL